MFDVFRRSRIRHLRSFWGRPRNRTRSLAAILQSHRDRITALRETAQLDDRTWSDLSLDDVFGALDRTVSTLGQHALFHRLRASDPETLPAFEALVERFTTDIRAREDAQLALAPLQDAHGYNVWWLAGDNGAWKAPAWHAVFPVLTVCSVAAIVLGLTFHAYPIVIATLLTAFAFNLATVRQSDGDAAALRQVAPLIAAAQSLPPVVDTATHPLVGALDELPSLVPLKWIARLAGDNPLLVAFDSNAIATMANDAVKVCYEYANLFFLIDRTAVFFGRAHLHAHGPRLARIVAALGEVDAALSVASLRAGTAGWSRPRFIERGPARVVGVVHPLVDAAVPNSIHVASPHGVLVTGSNMSGKSTFLRALGVAAVMGQSLNTCLASEYEAPVFRVRSVIGRADDLLHGKSYYLVEVEALLELVRAGAGNAPHLFLVDELFRGTNAVERIAAGEAVLRELVWSAHGARPHVVVAATHDNELVDLLSDCYAPYHFADSIGADGLVFSYRIADGPATTRNAITLLQLEGAPDTLIRRALQTASRLDRGRGAPRV